MHQFITATEWQGGERLVVRTESGLALDVSSPPAFGGEAGRWTPEDMLVGGIEACILLTTMFISGPLEFSIFPSMLLITTLLRLALNISSTRLILSNGGQAGKVIETFGHFVLGGNPIVGFIVFIIILIVQFVVITKGAERIAEVSARW